MRHFYYLGCAAIAASLWTSPIQAQSTVYLPDVVELSGPGAVSGTNWRDGAALAIDEINKAGGILGRKFCRKFVIDVVNTMLYFFDSSRLGIFIISHNCRHFCFKI